MVRNTFTTKFERNECSANSNNPIAKYYFKRPLSKNTFKKFFDKFEELKILINNLEYYNFKSNTKLDVISSNFKTGFFGFLINAESLKILYNDLILNDKLDYILTYKFSQDHLELFFGLIRYRTDRNDNPSCKQFISSYKRLIINKIIKPQGTGNVSLPEILSISSKSTKSKFNLETNETDVSLDLVEVDLDEYACDIITYLAGYIQFKQLNKFLLCKECLQIVNQSEKLSNNLNLLNLKKWGNLKQNIYQILCECEKIFKMYVINEKCNYNKLVLRTLQNVTILNLQFNDNENHLYTKTDIIDNHFYILLTTIIDIYFKIRMFHFVKNSNMKKLEYGKN